MKYASPFIAGLLFGCGLILSGMVSPQKVLGFLDFAGAWDPSLAFVMGGALAVAALGFRASAGRRESFCGAPMPAAPSRKIDARLMGGALIFGVGWGLDGMCPGPAIANIGFFSLASALFVLAMAAGMKICDLMTARVGQGG
jgi:uncharacterized membrane protein YedE/YeeE